MSHFLTKGDLGGSSILGKPRAMVKVKVRREKSKVSLEIVPGIGVAKPDTILVALPDRIPVLSPDGEVVKPSRGSSFWVTVETIDPFHGVMELPGDWKFR